MFSEFMNLSTLHTSLLNLKETQNVIMLIKDAVKTVKLGHSYSFKITVFYFNIF